MINVLRPIPIQKIRLLVWDLDGTLVDSMPDLATSVNAVREARGLSALPLPIIQSYVGSGARTLMQRSLAPIEGQDLDQALASFLDIYEKHLLDQTRPYAGIPELLRNLEQRFTLAVLTNKPDKHSLQIMEGLELSSYFKGIYGGDSFKVRKPDPTGALEMLKTFGVMPEEAIMIGDSDNDSLTAKHAGMWSIGVRYGYSPESFERAPADIYVDDVGEIMELLNKG